MSASGLSDRDWDAVIVGAGMGGGAAAFALARHGRSVLLLEFGGSAQDLSAGAVDNTAGNPVVRKAAGWWPEQMVAVLDGRERRQYFSLGCGVGGSSVLYAASLERMERRDFQNNENRLSADPAALPNDWPIDYDDFLPYYRAAEKLLGVSGGVNPLDADDDASALAPPPPLSPRDAALFRDMEAAGLHPYQQHSGIGYFPECAECIGVACPRRCKGDARTAFIDRAREAGAVVIENCRVTRILADSARATGVACELDGEAMEIRTRTVILAAGAIFTPKLLLQSASDEWPNGLANSSGLVGKGVMFHMVNRVMLWPRSKETGGTPVKSISLRDFYAEGDDKFGYLHAMGLSAGFGNIKLFLEEAIERTPFRRLPLRSKLLSIIAMTAHYLFGRAVMYDAILEDYPYSDNRVELDASSPSGVRVVYQVRPELKARARRLRRMIRKRLRRNRAVVIDHDVAPNYGHGAGTARMSNDPAQGVIDSDCQAHDLAGLYIVDSSAFASSAGVNPALTIAANAMRAADAIERTLGGAGATPPAVLAADADFRRSGEALYSRADPAAPVDLAGRTVVITGVGAGLGRALAEGFIADGARVLGVGRREAPLAALATAHPGAFHYIVGDAALQATADRAIAAAKERFGGVDILINNAATYPKQMIEDGSIDDWWAAMETNVRGPLAFTRAALTEMRRARFGRIIFIGSFADRGFVPGSSAYAVSKAALHALARNVAGEVNRVQYPDIAVNEFMPAAMTTAMGAATGEDPASQYPLVRDLVIRPANGPHGAMFHQGAEVIAPKGLKQKLRERLGL